MTRKELEALLEHYKSLVDAFFSGNVPEGGTLQHFIMAKYGRFRHEDMRPVPALLAKTD
jgi:hypothetical protein